MGMTSRERVIRTLTFSNPDAVPRHVWPLPGVEMFREDELADYYLRWPDDIVRAEYSLGKTGREKGTPYIKGAYTDAWGSTWHVGEDGVGGEVKEPALADWAALKNYKLPWELIKNADMSQTNRSVADTDCFVIAGGETHPFERLQHLRGTQNLLVDLGYGTAEMRKLLEMIHEIFIGEMELLAATDIDGVHFNDDWGSQTSLLISPEMWRDLFKPLYADYCRILHDAGKFIFFHSDGMIESIYDDLLELGIHAVNSQLFCMDIERLGEKYKGRITFWGEIDRQHILPFGTEEEVRDAVRRVRKALYSPEGGVIAQCEWGVRDPAVNIETVMDEWNR